MARRTTSWRRTRSRSGKPPEPGTEGRRRIRRTAGLFALTLACAPPPPFDPDREGEILPGEVDRYSATLTAGETVRIEIDQTVVDVAARVRDPKGDVLLDFDTETGTYLPERFCFTAPASATFTVEIEAAEGGAGRYRIERSGGTEPCAEATRTFAAARKVPPAERERQAEELGRAADLWRRAGETALAALAFRDAGSAWYLQNRGDRAVEAFGRGLGLARQAASRYLEVSILNRLGLALLERGRLEDAGATLRDSLRLAREYGDRPGEASALLNLGRVDQRAGNPHLAIARYRQALPLWRELGNVRELAQSLLNLADAYGVLERHDEALDVLEEGLELARGAGDEARESYLLSAQAWTHYLREDPAAGVPLLRRAVEIRRRLGDVNGEASALSRLGTLLHAAGELAAAEREIKRSLELSRAAGSPGDVAANRVNLGCLYREMDRLDEADRELTAAGRHYAGTEDPHAASHLAYCYAQLARDRGDLSPALDHAKRSLAIVDRVREMARSQGHRYAPVSLWQDYAQLRVDLRIARFRDSKRPQDLAAAFEAGDLDRARNLFELVIESRLAPRSAEEELAGERRIQDELNRLARRRHGLESAEPAAELDRRIRALRLELEELRAGARAAARAFADLAVPRPVTVAELRHHLGPGTILLSYDLGETASHLFKVSAGGIELFDLGPRSTLEQHAEALYHALASSQHSEQWQYLAARLHDFLIPEGVLPADARRLLVVAEGILHYVPFGALVAAPGTGGGDAWPELLLDRLEVVHLPSAAVFAALRERQAARPPAPATLALFADPVYSLAELEGRRQDDPGESATRGISAERLPAGRLPRLPWTRREADAILSRVPAGERTSAMGFDATKESVRSAELRRYRLLHFALHARIDEEFPELSSLILSTVDRRGETLDGELRLHEIYRLRLAADLTVLSGCQTALGRRVRGDGLVGLTRGFLFAGSSRLLVSLWSVDDRATAELMGRFYEHLLERGESPAQALRAAQHWLRGQPEWQAPYYWAAFVLLGDF